MIGGPSDGSIHSSIHLKAMDACEQKCSVERRLTAATKLLQIAKRHLKRPLKLQKGTPLDTTGIGEENAAEIVYFGDPSKPTVDFMVKYG